MKSFYLRFTVFIFFWLMMIADSGVQVMSLLFLTVSLVFFFFLSDRHASFYVYVILSALIVIHGLLIKHLFYSVMLLLLVTILASIRFSGVKFNSLVSLHLLYTLLLVLYTDAPLLFTVIPAAMFCFILFHMMKLNRDYNEQKAMYEQLLTEYRQLKRMHITTEEVAKVEERTRIAREIHDSVGHRLTALLMKIEMLHIKKPNEQLLELKKMANDSLQETREAVRALQTTEATGLSAIVQLIRKLEAESQLLIEFTLKEGALSIPLSNEQGIVLYRIIQESLTNVMRHSSSKQVSLEMGKAAIDGVTFTVKNPHIKLKPFTPGFGIDNMEARLKEIGGKLNVYQTEEYFIVSGLLPINKEAELNVAYSHRG